MHSAIVLLFNDQLTQDLKVLKDNPKHPVLMAETWDDFTNVAHHKKKLVFILSSMRHFAQTMAEKRSIDYIAFKNKPQEQTFDNTIGAYIKKHNVKTIIATHPSEYRQLKALKQLEKDYGVDVQIVEDERFFYMVEEGKAWVKKQKSPMMETFYRMIRKQTGYLMEDDKPIGGQWNYDKENRKPPKKGMTIPHIDGFEPDDITLEVIKFVEKHFKNNFGDIEAFWYGVTRKQALTALNRFIKVALADFGTYQDAMLKGEAFIYHSVLSQYINVGLLKPSEVCDKVEQAYLDGAISLACAEGFIRQIIGWREYVRMIYWAHMPGYLKLNVLNYKQKLPSFYWTGDTKMNCLANCIKHTKQHAYSHHIQRLMITGNFAMLIGIKPELIHEWYLIVYIDAFEWVELPNTVGMATYADGGIVGTKPYVAGGNYINKMSNFCGDCHYDVKQKTGPEACPFNYLYWHFLITHKDKLKSNHRLRMPYNTLSKMQVEHIKQIQMDAKAFINQLNFDSYTE